MKEALKGSPGAVVRDAMEAKGWSQSDLAYALGSTTAAINQILSNKRSISQNMARALAVALDRPAEVFARAQADWDVSNAEEPAKEIAARARILSQYPLREMIRRGWFDPEHGKGSLVEQVCQFFGVKSLEEVPHLDHSPKKTNYDDIPPAQLAWLFRVRQIASEMYLDQYGPDKLQEAVSVLKTMREDAEQIRRVPRVLSAAGVRFVIVEGLPGSGIDGVCFWLNENQPVIGMSLRYDRIDNFWFVLRHECSHVLHGHGKAKAIVDVDLDAGTVSTKDEEIIANSEAAEFCVPQNDLNSFYLRKKPFFSERDLEAFSKRVHVHPGLVAGQLHRLLDRYDLFRRHLVKIRFRLADSMLMDGWRNTVPVER